ncbi:hypothetical protein [Bosea rubneri]|uniref:Helix-turn-helix domain-containing protein n=1 Tax=Bosea rubneri TaxID=3075434 RepID=A0ABU3SEI0_9HYPH|nr:hypothetical protein [Bosea sp. ZW T0_25]MDU0343172.1 hypothetical protein [Bosea sp. ZW T0_25]
MQGDMFGDVPDAPKEPEIGSSFRTAVQQLRDGALAAKQDREQREAAEAEAASDAAMREHQRREAERERAEEAERQAALDEADMARPADNVIPMRREREPKNDGRGDFFAIDHRLWPKVCGLGLNAAVAYLVLARGTGGDNRTTSWSVNAIEKRTNISRAAANKAVLTLQVAGLIDKGGKPRRPQYFIEPLSRAGADPNSDLTPDEAKMLSAFKGLKSDGLDALEEVPETAAKHAWMGLRKPRQVAMALAKRGLLEHVTGDWFKLTKKGGLGTEEGDWTWLPNILVEPMEGAASPIERVRQSQFLPALQLFIDMYHAHDLKGGRGVEWRDGLGLRDVFERHKVGENSIYVIWGFKPLHSRIWPSGTLAKPLRAYANESSSHMTVFWKALRILTNAGLVGDVPHLIESNDFADPDEAGDKATHTSSSGEVIHPLPHRRRWPGLSHPDEAAITAAAERASQAMVSVGQWTAAVEKGCSFVVPVKASIPDVALVGIYRLRHAPKTAATRDWGSSAEEWRGYVAHYDQLAAPKTAAGSAISRGDQG